MRGCIYVFIELGDITRSVFIRGQRSLIDKTLDYGDSNGALPNTSVSQYPHTRRFVFGDGGLHPRVDVGQNKRPGGFVALVFPLLFVSALLGETRTEFRSQIFQLADSLVLGSV